MMPRWRCPAAAGQALILFVAACGQITPGTASPEPPDPGRTMSVYSVTSADGKSDSAFVHETWNSTGQAAGADRLVTPGSWVYPIETHTSSTPPSWQVGTGEQGRTLNSVGLQAAEWSTDSIFGPDEAGDQTAMGADGTVAYPSRSYRGVDTMAPDGSVKSYPIAPPSNCPSPSPQPPQPVSVPSGQALVVTEAVVFGPDGHVIAAVPGCAGTLILDLTAGRRASAGSECGRVEGMGYGVDGNLYLMCLELVNGPGAAGYPYGFVVMNYSTLKVVGQVVTSYRATGGTTFSMAMTDTAAFAYIVVENAPGPPSSYHLYQLSFGGNAVQEVPLATTADKVHGIGNGTLLFYGVNTGAIGGDLVTSWKPAAGPMSSVAVSTPMGPSGSEILAVFVG